jgi:uncharacterized membrane protein
MFIASNVWGVTVQGLGFLPGHTQSEALNVSEDGSIVFGMSYGGDDSDGFVWTQATGMQSLTLPGQLESTVTDYSADGRTAVGYSSDCSVSCGLGDSTVWTPETGLQSLTLPGYDYSSLVSSFAPAELVANGSAVIGGRAPPTGGLRSFILTPEDGLQGLGMLPGDLQSYATGVSEMEPLLPATRVALMRVV